MELLIKKLEFSFHIYDLNHDHFIQRDELEKMLHTVCFLNGKKTLAKEEEDLWVKQFIEDTFANFDENKDGRLSFEEFKRAAMSKANIQDIFTLHGLIAEE